MQAHAENFLLQLKQPLISLARWEEIYSYVKKLEFGRRFGYGIQVMLSESLLRRFPELRELRDTYRFADEFYFLITHSKARHFPVHIDGRPGAYNAASLNWPLRCCDADSVTRWFLVENASSNCIDGTYFLEEGRHTGKEIFRAAMRSEGGLPYLFRSDIWHSGYCGAEHKRLRIIVKWMLKFNSWENACDAFRNKSLL